MKKKPSKYLIYGLVDPITDELRYIGRSSSGLNRPRQHLAPCVYNSEQNYCHNWIKGLARKKLRAKIVVIEELTNNLTLNEDEPFWISYFKGIGCRLTNLTDGGFGFCDYVRLQARKPFYDVFTGQIYQTLKEAADENETSDGYISRVLSKKLRHCKKRVYRYVDEKFEFSGTKEEYLNSPKKVRSNSKPFIEIGSQKIFQTVPEASNYFKIKKCRVSKSLKSNKSSRREFLFVYLEEYNKNIEYRVLGKACKIKEETTGLIFINSKKAIEHFNIPSTSFRRALNNKTINGLRFIYV